MKVKTCVLLFCLLPRLMFALIPDTSAARRQLLPLLQAPVSEISVEDEHIIDSPLAANPISFELEENADKLYFIFKNGRGGEYPNIGAGNIIIRRSLDSGRLEQVKIYLDDIGALVMRIVPSGRRSIMSLALFNDLLYDKIPIGVGIEQVMVMDVADIIELSAGRIAWEELFPAEDLSVYQPLARIVEETRRVLPFLPDTEDGAMDAGGNLVQIETLGLHALPGFNCSGFAKFVTDGVYSQFGKGFMKIDRLKTKHLDLRGNTVSAVYEESRDPYFGLDWTRNIATEIASLQQGRQLHPEDSDVRSLDFYSYQEDVGYAMSELLPVLYLQSIRSPGKFYLGSINGEFGRGPQLWQHFHVVVLYPYFDDEGRFRISVMERNLETSIASLKQRYPQQFIHLVGIEPEDDFSLPQL